MSKVKKILSMLLAVAMVLTIAPASVLASAYELVNDEYYLEDDENYVVGARVPVSTWTTPNFTVSTSATKVIRVASSAGAFTLGNTIVQATPSGVPKADSGTFIDIGYAGETPAWPTITFEIDGVSLAANPNLSSSLGSNMQTVFVGKTESGTKTTYTWRVSGGTASAGDNVIYTMTYSVGGANYYAYAYAHVENILNQPGTGQNKKRTKGGSTGSSKVGRHGFLCVFQSENMYPKVLSQADNHGFINWASGSGVSGGAVQGMGSENTIAGSGGDQGSAFLSCVPNNNIAGEQQAVVFKTSISSNDANSNAGYKNDGNRAGATVYIDTSSETLRSLNMRATLSNYESSNWTFTRFSNCSCRNDFWEGSSDGSYSSDKTGCGRTTDASIFDSSWAATEIRSVGDFVTATFSGTGAPASPNKTTGDTLDYSVLLSVYSTQSTSDDPWIQCASGFNTTFISYDKGQLREVVNGILAGDGSTYNASYCGTGNVTFNKGKDPQEGYYTQGWADFKAKFDAANIILATPDTSMSAINTATSELITAYNGLGGRIDQVTVTVQHVNQTDGTDLFEPLAYNLAPGATLTTYPASTMPGYVQVGSEASKVTTITNTSETQTVTWYYTPANKTVAAFSQNPELGEDANHFYTTAIGSTFDTAEATEDVGERPYYEFAGWYYDSACSDDQAVPATFTMPNDNVSIYGKWVTAPVHIYCDPQIDGLDPIQLDDDTYRPLEEHSIAFPRNTARPADLNISGYIFVEYYSDAALTQVQQWPINIELGDSDITIYARLVDVNGLIIFESNGGTPVADEQFDSVDDIVAPTAPTRPGYTFNGWYLDRECTTPENGINWSDLPASVLTAAANGTGFVAYADWIPENHLVKFNTNVGNNPSRFDTTSIQPIEGPTDSVIPNDMWPNDPQRFGYTFSHWVIDGTSDRYFEAGQTYTFPASDITLKAMWRPVSDSAYVEVDAYEKILGELVEADTVATDDIVTVRMNVTANFDAGSSAYIIMYDNTFFEPLASGANEVKLNPNNHYVSGINAQYSVVDSVPANVWPDGLDNTNYTAIQIAIDPTISSTTYKVVPLDGNEYMVEMQFRVIKEYAPTDPEDLVYEGTIYMDNAWTRSKDNTAAPQFIGWGDSTDSKYEKVIDTVNDIVVPNMDYATATVVLERELPPDTTVTAKANGGSYSDDNTGADRTYTGRVGTEILDYEAPTMAGFTLTEWIEYIDADTVDDTVTWVEGYYASEENDGKTFIAQWTPNDYTVNFYTDTIENGGTLKYSKTAPYQSEVKLSDLENRSFSKQGYTLAGWQDAEGTPVSVRVDGSADFDTTDPFYVPIDGANLYAVWEPALVSYKIAATYTNNNTGEVTTNNTIKVDNAAPKAYTGQTVMIVDAVPADPAENTVYITPDQLSNINGGGYYYDPDNNTLPISAVVAGDGTTVLNVNFKAKTVIATYDANGGAFADNSTTKTEVSEFQKKLVGPGEEPTREGYVFAGWKNGNRAVGFGEEDADVKLTADSTITAQWTALTYPVNFIVDGAAYGEPVQVQFGATIAKPTAPSKTGYDFLGWAATEDGDPIEGANLGVMDNTDGKTFYAKFELTKYSVTYFVDDEEYSTVENVTMGQTITLIAAPTREGHTFSGWTTDDATVADGAFTMPAGNVAVEGSFTANNYNVIFNANGGHYADDATTATVSVTYGTAITRPAADPERAGYNFLGYAATANATTTISNLGTLTTTEPVTYYAVWEANEVDYFVKFYRADATGSYGEPYATRTITGIVAQNVSYTPVDSDNDEEGYVLDTAASVLTGTVPAEGTLELAVKYDRVQYNLVTVVDGTSTTVQTARHGATIDPVADPTPAPGYVFKNWTPSVPATMPIDGYTINAVFDPIKYDVIFYEDEEGTTVLETKSLAYTSIIGSETPASKEGYSFVGWKVKGTDDIVEFTDTTPTVPIGGIEFVPVYTINKYTVTYRSYAGGEVYATFNDVEYGTTIPTPEGTPTRVGYNFTGWANVPASMPDRAVTINGSWAKNIYTITYNLYEGADPIVDEYEYLEMLPDDLPDPGEREGYTFDGWYEDEALTIELEVLPLEMPAENLTYYSKWTIQQFTITFADTGDNAIEAITRDYGTDLTGLMPTTDPKKTGYSFIEWDTTFPATMPAEDMTITALWQINKYRITFADAGNDPIADIYEDYGTDLTGRFPTAAPEKTGYSFIEWDKSFPATMPAEDMTITAQWQINKYRITFADAGDEPIADIYEDYGTDLTGRFPTAAPEKTGHTFDQWDTDFSTITTMPAENMTITAQWTRNQYTLKYVDSQNAETVYLEQEVYYDAALPAAPSTPSKEGHTFTAWSMTAPATMPANDVTIQALWDVNTYNIIIKPENGEANITIPYAFGQAIDADNEFPVLSREGYSQNGWDIDVPDTMPSHDVTLTAQWTINTYVITFVVNGGTDIDPISLEFGSAVTKPANPQKEGYTFGGWYADEDFQTLSAVPTIMPATNTTLYAKWNVNSYTVTFVYYDEYDSETVVSSYTDEYGKAIVAPAEEDNPTKEFYTFEGWSLDGGATVAQNLGTIPENGIVIIAVFDRVPVTLAIVPGSTTVIDPCTEENGYYAGENGEITGYIYGLEERLTESKLRSEYVAVEGDGELLVTMTKYNRCGTGTKIEVYDNVEERVVETYYIIIYGDVNGDSFVNVNDAAVIADEVNYITVWSEYNEGTNPDYDYCKVLASHVAPTRGGVNAPLSFAEVNAIREVALLEGEISQTTGCYEAYAI